ncbi:MAG: DUF4911 domain-containing protein [Sandaracinaceae bacterium]
MSAPLFLGPGLVARTIEVERADVAWVRYVVEAHDGLANLHGDKDGTITLVTTPGMLDELDRLIGDLSREIALRVRVSTVTT